MQWASNPRCYVHSAAEQIQELCHPKLDELPLRPSWNDVGEFLTSISGGADAPIRIRMTVKAKGTRDVVLARRRVSIAYALYHPYILYESAFVTLVSLTSRAPFCTYHSV